MVLGASLSWFFSFVSKKTQIAALKEEKLSLESAIRAASLSSDFAEDYELQVTTKA